MKITVFIVKHGYTWEGYSIKGIFLFAKSALKRAKKISKGIDGIRRAHLGRDRIMEGTIAIWEDPDKNTGSLEYVMIAKHEVELW